MNPAQFVAVRVGLRRVAAGCDRDFDYARGVPRLGAMRRELEIRRQYREQDGAAPDVFAALAVLTFDAKQDKPV